VNSDIGIPAISYQKLVKEGGIYGKKSEELSNLRNET